MWLIWFYTFPKTQSNQCFCGNSYGRYGSSSDCNTACPISFAYNSICGGSSSLNVYTAYGITKKPFEYLVKNNFKICINLGYLGCYADTQTSIFLERDVSGVDYMLINNSPQNCINTCSSKSYLYAAVQNG